MILSDLLASTHPTGSETTTPYAPQSSRFGSEPPSVDYHVDIWRYAMLELHARNDDDDDTLSSIHAVCLKRERRLDWMVEVISD